MTKADKIDLEKIKMVEDSLKDGRNRSVIVMALKKELMDKKIEALKAKHNAVIFWDEMK